MFVFNQRTAWGVGFSIDSDVFGDWSGCIAFDVVSYAVQNFRTTASRDGRGIASYSMDGFGLLVESSCNNHFLSKRRIASRISLF